jgi:uncharacterized membrane protein YcjF (UPF0283 family)
MLIASAQPGDEMLQTSLLGRLAILIFLGLSTVACELAGDIFQAGVWMGVLAVVAVVVLVVVAVAKLRG